jgi:hypothetical protein
MNSFCEGVPRPDGYLSLIMQDYAHPREVLSDDRLDAEDQRSILCFWASDACAVESRPGFRWLPGTPGPISFDHVIAALQALDQSQRGREPPRYLPRPLRGVHAGA